MSSDPSDNRIVKSPNQVAYDASPLDPQRSVKDEEDHLDDLQLLPPRIHRTSGMLPVIFASDEEEDASPLNLTININTKPRRSVSDSQLIVFKPNVCDEVSFASDDNSESIMKKGKRQKSNRHSRSRNLLRRLSSLLHRKEKKQESSLDHPACPSSYVLNSTDNEMKSGSSEHIHVSNPNNTSYDLICSQKQMESNSDKISTRDGYAFRDVPTMQSMSSISFSQASRNCNSILDHSHDEDDHIQEKSIGGKHGSKSSKTLATVSTSSTGFLLTCMDSAIDTFSEGVSCCKSDL
jgi:hypothetical protein